MNFNDQNARIVVFLRHGETDWNSVGRMQGTENVQMNDTGRAQARAIAEGLKNAGCKWDAIYCSPLDRARETARFIADALGMDEPIPDARLIEKHFGKYSALLYNDYSRAVSAPDFIPSELESEQAIAERLNSFLNEKSKLHKRMILVSHGAAIRSMAKSHPHTGDVASGDVFIANCCGSFYEKIDGTFTLCAVNIPASDLPDFVKEHSK